MARKGQFKKGGGRHGSTTALVPRKATHKRRKASIRHVGAGNMVVVAAKRTKGRRRSGGGHGITPVKLAGTAIVLASVAGTNNGPLGSTVYDWVQKIPGSKTFGGAATAGLVIGGLYKYTRIGGRLRPLMACAGLVGLVAAGLKLGEQGTSFKWLGDADESASDRLMDVEA